MTTNVVKLDTGAGKAKAGVPAFRFTSTSLKKTTTDLDKAGATNVILRDTEFRGLTVRKQTRDWKIVLERKIRGKKHRVTIQDYSHDANVAAIRDEAGRIVAGLINGTAPTKETLKQADTFNTMTVAQAVDLHMEENPRLRPATARSYRFAADWLTDGKSHLMRDIDKAYVRNAYERLLKTHSASTANLMLRSVKALWNTWDEDQPGDRKNPVSAYTSGKRKGRVVESPVREGALTPDQRAPWFASVMRQVTARGPSATSYAALGLLFLTGCRAQEVLALRWDEIGDDVIVIPADRMKGGKKLTRPITDGMRTILDHQRLYHPDSEWVFPARVGNGHMGDLRKAIDVIGTNIKPHDLRRTYVSCASLAGVPDVAIKLLVGHTVTDITESYALALRTELPAIAERIEGALLS